MTVAVLGAKSAIAVLLLIAGGAKVADLRGFGAAIRLFVPAALLPRVAGQLTVAAAAVACAELATGAASLCWPAVGWLNLTVLALACGFAIVAGVGYVRHRGRPCRCYGALTRRSFGLRTVGQALVLVAAAVLATGSVRPADIQLGLAAHLLLLAAAGAVAAAAATAAKALLTSGPETVAEVRPGMAV